MEKTVKLIGILFVLCGFCLGTAQDTYKLSSDSKLTIDGTSTVHDWTVTANSMQGNLKADGALPKEIDFQVDVADIKSERGATMDKKMHDALKKEEHPKVLFVLKEVKEQNIISGTLTIAGNSKDVAIESTISSSGNTIKISGEKEIALAAFDIEPPTAMFGQVIVGDDIVVKFDLVFEKK